MRLHEVRKFDVSMIVYDVYMFLDVTFWYHIFWLDLMDDCM